MSNVLVKDDSNPLIEYSFVPVKGDRPMWRTQIAGLPIDGQMTYELLVNEQLPDGNWRRVTKLVVPEMETQGTAGTSAGYVAPQKVAFKTPYTLSTIVNQRATAASMANGLKLCLGLHQGASSVTATGTINQASAADAVKNSTAIAPRFMVYGEEPV
jgi:hypothetical protein